MDEKFRVRPEEMAECLKAVERIRLTSKFPEMDIESAIFKFSLKCIETREREKAEAAENLYIAKYIEPIQ